VQTEEVTGARKQGIQHFLSIFETLEASTSADRVLTHILEKSGYKQFLMTEYEKTDAELRVANIEELQRAVEHFNRNGVVTVEQFLYEVALLQDKAAEQDTHSAPVSLMTLHASKGLEFDFVVIPGLEECVLPSQKALSDPEALEEERRLLYVGITRARELLLLTYAQYRYLFSQVTDQMRSRFLDDMSSQIRTEIDSTKSTQSQVAATIKLWLLGKLHESVKSTSKDRDSAKVAADDRENWRKFQLVSHASYGVGTIQRVELTEESTYLTISFKSGVRKIAAQFVTSM
jgi:DNA helicase-2/ATP-dependent DNA helicase PcrA